MSIESRNRRERHVFMSIAAQADNLGDIVIRQAAVNIVATSPGRLIVFVGSMPVDYISAFDFPDRTELVSRPAAFMTKYLMAVLKRRVHLIFAPGPLQIRSGIKPAVKASVNLGNILLARLSGGRVIALGRAIRGRGWPSHAIERLAIPAYSLFIARDDVSARVINRKLERAPDLAFLRPIDASRDSRSHVAFSLRGDREIAPALLRSLVTDARAAGLIPVFVTQVARDDIKHRELAAELEVDVVGWDGTDHRAQIALVENLYRTCRYVISDRLHALVLGMVKGGEPIALVHPGSDKLNSTLDGLVRLTTIDSTALEAPTGMFKRSSTGLAGDIDRAQRTLMALANRVRAVLAAPGLHTEVERPVDNLSFAPTQPFERAVRTPLSEASPD